MPTKENAPRLVSLIAGASFTVLLNADVAAAIATGENPLTIDMINAAVQSRDVSVSFDKDLSQPMQLASGFEKTFEKQFDKSLPA